MLELFPEGFEEVESSDGVELIAYTDPGGEERLWQAFGGARGQDVAADWRDRWKALRPEMSPMPPARLLMIAVRTASARSLSPDDAPPELISGERPMWQLASW